ncbi:uncharacterized protein EV422DRAFT_508306 [Fimicolochytrium jonesii]|uniref:uncharacterized protein n=1 Tax=Fimicolochytrium jonesii TaxID=1396493 RepID=UPI0022FE5B8B|nr:uncharacterized protein EV422DRAFT_508306 [Fimicolochytrium jonesii]KAI8818080.1 hypothetical protein EV422DRAFT_508306 [Fimicolochytrium jonesii]
MESPPSLVFTTTSVFPTNTFTVTENREHGQWDTQRWSCHSTGIWWRRTGLLSPSKRAPPPRTTNVKIVPSGELPATVNVDLENVERSLTVLRSEPRWQVLKDRTNLSTLKRLRGRKDVKALARILCKASLKLWMEVFEREADGCTNTTTTHGSDVDLARRERMRVMECENASERARKKDGVANERARVRVTGIEVDSLDVARRL